MKERRNLILATLAVFALALIALYFLSLERDRQIAVQQTATGPVDPETQVLESQSREELELELFFYRPGALDPAADFLVTEQRKVFATDDPVLLARQILVELFKGSDQQGPPLFAENARIRQLYILSEGTAVVDFPQETVGSLLGGTISELAAIRSITASLVGNLEEVDRVIFLVEGRTSPTLAGHVSIAKPFM